MKDDLPESYLQLRRAAEASNIQYGALVSDDRSTDMVNLYKYFDIDSCDRNDEMEARTVNSLEMLARYAEGLRKGLREAGYNEEVYNNVITTFEINQLKNVGKNDGYYVSQLDEGSAPAFPGQTAEIGTDKYDLAAMLDKQRKLYQPEMPPISREGGCGGGETSYTFKSIPSGANMWITTSFSFALCRARHIDPWDRFKCDRWTEVSGGLPVFLSGRYVYYAKWPDGRTALGMRDLAGGDPETEAAPPQSVIFRPLN